MRLSCRDALHYLVEGKKCRGIAEREAPTLPASAPDDLLQELALKLLRSLKAGCPGWSTCPACDGGGSPPCHLPPDGDDGEAYIRQSLRYAIRSVREAGRRRPILDGRVLAGESEALPDPDASWTFADLAPPVADAVEHKLLVALLASDLDRIVAGEAPQAVWPGVRGARLGLKVDAAEMVLQGDAVDALHVLRLLAPGYYGHPDVSGEHTAAERKRASRDGADVQRICRSVWERELG